MLLCGFYEREITPPLDGHMPGGFLINRAIGVKSRLYCKAASFEDTNKRAIIISVDILDITKQMHDKIVERITEFTGIKSKDILISATHSHSAGSFKPFGEFNEFDTCYFEVFLKQVADCAILAYQRMVPVTAKYASCNIEGISFNRNFKMKDGTVRTTPENDVENIKEPFGPIDPEFSTIYFFNEKNEAIGAIMNFACHHCCVGLSYYSSDYSGVLAKELKKTFGLSYVNLFINGACGNINHYDLAVKEIYRVNYTTPRYIQMGKLMAEKALELYEKAEPVNLDTIDTRKELIYIKRNEIPEELVEERRKLYDEMKVDSTQNQADISHPESPFYKRLSALGLINLSELPKKLPVYVQAIRLGDCMIYALPHEMYTEFGLEIKEKSAAKINIIAELSNGVEYASYIPIKEAFGTTIYEAQMTSAIFEPETGYQITKKALELGNELMKK